MEDAIDFVDRETVQDKAAQAVPRCPGHILLKHVLRSRFFHMLKDRKAVCSAARYARCGTTTPSSSFDFRPWPAESDRAAIIDVTETHMGGQRLKYVPKP